MVLLSGQSGEAETSKLIYTIILGIHLLSIRMERMSQKGCVLFSEQAHSFCSCLPGNDFLGSPKVEINNIYELCHVEKK